MYPVLFNIGPISVYSYGLAITAAFFVSTYLAKRSAAEAGIHPDVVINMGLIILFPGIIGARLLYVVLNIEYYLEAPVEILLLQHGGLAFYGGTAAALCAGIVYVKKKGISIYKVGDLLAPYAALGQAIGRIGCFLNGCCFGRPTDSFFGVVFPGRLQAIHPTQVYSSLLMIFLYGFLRLLQKLRLKQGAVLFSYGLLYSLGRFFMEFLRGDNVIILAGLTFSQIASVAVFLGCAGLLWKNTISNQSRKTSGRG